MNSEYKRALNVARAELEKLEVEREDISRRITQLKQTIFGLAKLCDDGLFLKFWAEAFEAVGITENCRDILKNSSAPLKPLEVKEELLKLGLDANNYSNLLASIHSVLKRLVESREVRTVECNDGSIAYGWRRPHRRRWRKLTSASLPSVKSDIQ